MRGAQRSLGVPVAGSDGSVDPADYVKVYLPGRAGARLLPYGYVAGVARPGYGCQYTVTLRDVAAAGDGPQAAPTGARCTVRVLTVTPMLFAPRVQFAAPVAAAWVDGQPWSYFDGAHVFLPNRTDDFDVRVQFGRPTGAHLLRTYASIRECRWEPAEESTPRGVVAFAAGDPPWAPPLIESAHYYALVQPPPGAAQAPGLDGAEVVRPAANGALLVRFRPGVVRLAW